MPRSRSIAIQSERAHRWSPRALTSPASLDRPAQQQQFLGQRGLAGIRMRNDRKRPPARQLVARITHQSVSIIPGVRPLAASAPPRLHERWI
jgi:hypothetical protein